MLQQFTWDGSFEKMKKFIVYVCIVFFVPCLVVGKESEKWVKEKIEQVHVGNFCLPLSQQPGPLVGFGQNVVDQGDFQLFGYIDQYKGKEKNFIEALPFILYGLSEKLVLMVSSACALKFKEGSYVSRGIEDLVVQLEGVVYASETVGVVDEITLVGNMSFPTGLASQQPPTGFGAPTVFLGFTASRTKTDWYYFTAMGGVLPTSHHQTRFGKQFLYQFGLSKNIAYKTDSWMLAWMVELDGVYKQRDKIKGVIDANSGGNTVILGPSLWFSTQRFVLQGGISVVVAEHLFGMQNKDKYFAAVDVGWKF